MLALPPRGIAELCCVCVLKPCIYAALCSCMTLQLISTECVPQLSVLQSRDAGAHGLHRPATAGNAPPDFDMSLRKQRTSAMSLGWQPSPRCRSACFISSPIRSTVDVVPSLRHAEHVLCGLSREGCLPR